MVGPIHDVQSNGQIHFIKETNFDNQVCGDVSVWKPSETTPLISVAVTKIVESVLQKNNIPGAVAALCVGGKDIGAQLVKDERMKLVSFTGSTAVGQQVFKESESQRITIENDKKDILTYSI